MEIAGLRVNMKNKLMPFYDKMMLRKRYIIETINNRVLLEKKERKNSCELLTLLTPFCSSALYLSMYQPYISCIDKPISCTSL